MRIKALCAGLLALPLAASAQSVDLSYEVTDLGGGLFQYDFELTTDAGWAPGMGWRWFIFGDCAGCPTPLTGFVGDPASLPIGPWTGYSSSSGGHNGPTLSPVLEYWTPLDGEEFLVWSGTSTADLPQGDLLFSTIAGTIGGAVAADFKVATREGGGGGVCPSCLADCDGSGELDFFDFLCFQNLFAAGDLCADCDSSGTLDFFDFLCYQNEFSAGCPVSAIEQFGTEAPPSVLCGERMTSFPLDARPPFTVVTDVPSPLGGNLTFSTGCDVRTIGGGWATWSHGYTGNVYYTLGAASLDVGVPANSAFYLYAEPNPFALIEFEITRDGGDSVVDSIHGSSGAKGFGFCGGVKSVNVRTTDGFTDFAVGEFGIAN